MGTTWQQLIRIAAAKGAQPDTLVACNIHHDTPPEKVHVLIEDGVMYITEKRA